MNSLKLIVGLTITGVGIVMALTNPEKSAYEQYATETLNVYLKENGCNQLSEEIGRFLQNHCHSLIDIAKPQLSELIAHNTYRYNFLVFSIYQTDLFAPAHLPDYQVTTIGVLENFYIYQAEQI